MPEEDIDAALAGPVDSDEERDSVMSAIARSLAKPQPLYQHTIVDTRRRYQLVRMKEMLSNALNGNRSGNMFAVPAENKSAYPASATDAAFAIPQVPVASPALTGVGMAQPGMKASARKASVDPT
jgi:SAGA-associated factor 73